VRDAGLVYPDEMLAFLSQIGVDDLRETEIADFGREPTGMHVVSGWFLAIGHVVVGPDPRIPAGPNGYSLHTTPIVGDFEIALFEGRALAPPSLAAHPLIQVEFLTRLPWMLSETDPELSSAAPVV
jgi:hypothetical protein